MKSALIGYTGFVGSTLNRQINFTDKYNSKNIHTIQGKHYDLIISAGTSSLKWFANKNKNKDWEGIKKLLNSLLHVTAKEFILISTVDVYHCPIKVNEDAQISENELIQPYGLNRFKMEQFIRNRFSNSRIIRLPQLFGTGLKKNFIFDLIHNHCLDFTHMESLFQWYNIEYLWSDISTMKKNNITLLNMATEPIKAKKVALKCAGIVFKTVTETPPLIYTMHSKYGKLFGSNDNFLYHQKQILNDIRQLINTQRQS